MAADPRAPLGAAGAALSPRTGAETTAPILAAYGDADLKLVLRLLQTLAASQAGGFADDAVLARELEILFTITPEALAAMQKVDTWAKWRADARARIDRLLLARVVNPVMGYLEHLDGVARQMAQATETDS